jgi:hypothetical protein
MTAITYLTDNAQEQSTYAITVVFTDDNGDVVTPNTGLNWSLYNRAGSVVNSRGTVSITAAGTVTIALYGSDLDVDDGYERYLLVQGTYSSSLGTAMPLKQQARFHIADLVGVS